MTIRYISTRGDAPELAFDDVVLAGLASDGGLYVPNEVPQFSPQQWSDFAKLSYQELAVEIMHPFMGDTLTRAELKKLVDASYAEFRHAAIAPLVQIGHNRFILELFHGPTLAFKDFALQFLGRLMDHILTKRGERITIVGATSGDTGSAAIAGCRGCDNMDIFILHPEGRVSNVQRRQMTTVTDKNVHNIALHGTFDDCQDMVKALFNDANFRHSQKLAAVNSINWARILAQVVYYAYAALQLGAPAKEISFSVPTGNFGDIYAGHIARRMGLPIGTLCIASNRNDILTRCLKHGEYRMAGVEPSFSPSMDIQISSNFERLLFEVYEQDGKVIAKLMKDLREHKGFVLKALHLNRLRRLFVAASADDAETIEAIATLHKATGYLADPHTAVGLRAADECFPEADHPVVVLSTAHPAKFPDAVEKASGVYPDLPPHLEGILKAKERFEVFPADDMTGLKNFIQKHSKVGA